MIMCFNTFLTQFCSVASTTWKWNPRAKRENWGREKWMAMEKEKEWERVFSIRVNLARQFGPPFQRPNGRWTVMDSTCGLLINLGEAIGEALSTCSKLNKAYPEMALFSLNSPSAPLLSPAQLQGIRANKMRKFRHCEMMMDKYHTYSKKHTQCVREISHPIVEESSECW